MLKRLCLIFLFLLPSPMAIAQEGVNLEALINTLELRKVFDVMRDEGGGYGADLDRELLDGAGGEEWQKTVGDIYEPDRVWQTFMPRFAAELNGQDIDAMTGFFSTMRGRQITALEVSARRTMLDETLEEESRAAYRAMVALGDPRLTMLADLVEANDLIEFNVMGAMNASYAFYIGLNDGGAIEFELSQEDILKDVWSQETEIRKDTEEWIFAYLSLAYAPLSDVDLQAYIDFSNTQAGQALNAALFAGYDDVFSKVSKALGLSAAQIMRGKDL